jgi:hypothetical protein
MPDVASSTNSSPLEYESMNLDEWQNDNVCALLQLQQSNQLTKFVNLPGYLSKQL